MPEITQRARAGLEPSLTCCRSLLLEPTLIPLSLILPSSCPERTWELIEQWFLMTEGWTTPYWTSQEKVGASDGEEPGGLWGDHTEPRDCDVTCEVKCMGSHVTWGNRGTERLSDWPNAAQLVSGGGLVCMTLMPLLTAACHSEPRLQDQRPRFTPLPHNGPLAPHAVGRLDWQENCQVGPFVPHPWCPCPISH